MKVQSLIILITLCLCSLITLAVPGDKQDLIQSWERIQSQHSAVESFEKLSESLYNIKFKNIPYEGELVLLNYDIEHFGELEDYLPVSKSGYIEFDLPGLSDEVISKYSRSYQNWSQSNYLYFASDSQTWIDDEQYSQLIQDTDFDDLGLSYFVGDYIPMLLIGFFIYLTITSHKTNSRAKKAMAEQKIAFDHSLRLNEESMKLQKYAIKQANVDQKKTNELLESILNELKNKQ